MAMTEGKKVHGRRGEPDITNPEVDSVKREAVMDFAEWLAARVNPVGPVGLSQADGNAVLYSKVTQFINSQLDVGSDPGDGAKKYPGSMKPWAIRDWPPAGGGQGGDA